MCPKFSDTFYIVSYYLYKMGHYFSIIPTPFKISPGEQIFWSL